MNKRIIVSGVFVIIFIGFLVWYVNYGQKPKEASLSVPVEVEMQSAKNEKTAREAGSPLSNVSIETTDVGVNPPSQSAKTFPPPPNLDRIENIPSSVSLEAGNKMVARIKEIVSLLKKDPNLFDEWLDLGLLRKELKDYEGAREAWEYASIIRPKNSISFSNLGVLYGYYLKNNALAEQNYLKSIENDPKIPYIYLQVADFYLEVMNDKNKARAIIEKGIAQMPNDESLKQTLNSY